MSKVRVWIRPDGSVAFTRQMKNSPRTFEESMQRAMDNQPEFAACEYEDIDDSEVTMDKKYRNAWRKEKGKAFTIDATLKAEIDARPVYTIEEQMEIQAEMFRMAEESLDARSG